MRAMTEIIDPEVLAYAEAHSTEPPEYLNAVYAATQKEFPAWGMMVGRQEGRFLELMAFSAGAVAVLEIGTFTGYSALSMAAGLAPGGKIFTCEVDPHHAATARANIEASPHAGRIEILEGPALASLARLDGPFDLVFIDADKQGYDGYFEAVLPKLAPRGVILADNTLWRGAVVSPDTDDPDTLALRAFNDKLVQDPRVVCVLTTIRDGVTIIRRADA
jgi:caffeoyl-CoA O-methyltransferase